VRNPPDFPEHRPFCAIPFRNVSIVIQQKTKDYNIELSLFLRPRLKRQHFSKSSACKNDHTSTLGKNSVGASVTVSPASGNTFYSPEFSDEKAERLATAIYRAGGALLFAH